MNQPIYVSTYTIDADGHHRTDGIFLIELDPETGQLSLVRAVEAGPNPSFMAFSPDRQYLFVANEQTDGGVSAFKMDPQTLVLSPINSQPVQGADPCYLTVDPTGRWLLVACYSSGNLSVLPVEQDGRIGDLVQRIQLTGNGPNRERQEQAHAHSIRFDPSGRFALAADLGMDRVWVYRLDEQTGMLSAHTPPGLDCQPGAGPRHLEFHPTNKALYIANELGSTVTVCAWNAETGEIEEIQTLPTLPDDFSGENIVADIHLAPSGDYLYVSNRGHNSLAVFSVSPDGRTLAIRGIYSCGGDWPRNFAVDPMGKYVLVANQYSGDVVVLRCLKDGSLEPTGYQLPIPAAVCVEFI